MKAKCCNAKVPEPIVHEVHIHDIGYEAGLAVAVAFLPTTCECGNNWPCPLASQEEIRRTRGGYRWR